VTVRRTPGKLYALQKGKPWRVVQVDTGQGLSLRLRGSFVFDTSAQAYAVCRRLNAISEGVEVTEKKGVVVLLSGGLDSSTLLYDIMSEGFDPIVPMAVRYGQKHVRELRSAYDVAQSVSKPLVVVDLAYALKPVFAGALSSQVGKQVDVPIGHYAEPSMKLTIVPNRNMILLATAAALAVSRGCSFVAYAAHAGDHPVYPDCRPEFMQAMQDALKLGNTDFGGLISPFANISKTAIVQRGSELGVPFSLTYSCYEGRETHCGKCGTCFERREAFRDAGVEDPTAYESDVAA
jgi:7-cyano-7-deazaguanine synthase